MNAKLRLKIMNLGVESYGIDELRNLFLSLISAHQDILALCSRNGYAAWNKNMVPIIDGKYSTDEATLWEMAHGHDIRLPCYREFGCQLYVSSTDIKDAIDRWLGTSE